MLNCHEDCMNRIIFLVLMDVAIFLPIHSQWIQSNGPDNGRVGGIYCKNSVIYAATYDYVCRSTNNGATWEQIKNGFQYDEVISITGNGKYLFAGTTFSGLYRSTNYGENWTTIRGILPTNNIANLAWYHSDLLISGAEGIFRSTDLGTTWTKIFTVDDYGGVAGLFADDSLIYTGIKGLRISSDSGKTWIKGDSILSERRLQSYYRSDSMIYAGTDSGLYGMDLRTRKWKNIDPNLSTARFNCFTIIGEVVVAATNKGIVRTNDHWKSWAFIKNSPVSNQVLSVASDGQQLFAGTASRGVYRSLDSGVTWTHTGSITKRIMIQSMIVKDSLIIAGSNQGVHRSTNDGMSWEDISTDSVDYGGTVALQDSTMYAGNYWGLFERKLSGTSWKLIFSEAMVNTVKVSGDSIYLGTNHGVYYSPNRGKMFLRFDSSFTGNQVYTVGPFGKDLLIAGDMGVFRSADHGKHWKLILPSPDIFWVAEFAKNDSFYFAATGMGVARMRITDTVWTVSSNGLTQTKDVATITVHENSIFLGMRGGGVMYSTDKGSTWRSGNSVTTQYWNVFAVGINSRRVFFGGWNIGVWSSPLTRWVTDVSKNQTGIPVSTLLLQNYPNPFNPRTVISYSVHSSSNISLKIYDALGRHIDELVNDVQTAGNYSIVWDGSKNASGIYFAVMKYENNISMKKLLLIK